MSRTHPSSEADIQRLVTEAASAGRRVKVFGAGHSFTDIACTDGVQVSLDDYDKVLSVDRAARTATVQAGIRIKKLNAELAKVGLAMSNMGDIAYQSIAGAISTATHGCGIRFGNLATFVKEMTIVKADGSVLHCSPSLDDTTFKAAQVGLGALGVISTVTLQLEPAFNLEAQEEGADLDETLNSLDELIEGNEHFEFFWFPYTPRIGMKRNNRTDKGPTPVKRWKDFRNEIIETNIAFGLICRYGRARPQKIRGLMKTIAPGKGRIRKVARSDRIFASPRLVRFAEMEYAIPRANAREALERLRATIDAAGYNVNFPVEVRFVAGDDVLLSPAHGRETCYIAVHMYQGMDYAPYFKDVEAIMRSYDGRPHWGKLHFRTAADLAPSFPRWNDFIDVRNKLDPDGVFRNDYLDRVLGVPGA